MPPQTTSIGEERASSLTNVLVITRDEMCRALRYTVPVLGSFRHKGLRDLNYPGLGVHPLHGSPRRYAVYVNGPWRITFEWIDGDAWRVDLEQYH